MWILQKETGEDIKGVGEEKYNIIRNLLSITKKQVAISLPEKCGLNFSLTER